MPLPDEAKTAHLKGLELDLALLRARSDWYEQSASGHHYGLPRRKGLWVHEVEPFDSCSRHPVKLFVLVQLSAKGRIIRVETMVCQTHPDGSYSELDVPFFLPDAWTAAAELSEALTEADQARAARRKAQWAQEPVSLAELQAIAGTYLHAGSAIALVRRLGLSKALDPMEQGLLYSSHDGSLEIHGNRAGLVRSILFRPRPFDRTDTKGTPGLTRDLIRAWLGPPAAAHADPRQDRFETPAHVTLVTYDEGGNARRVAINRQRGAA